MDLSINNFKTYVAVSENFDSNEPYEINSDLFNIISSLQKLKCFEVEHFVTYQKAGLATKLFGYLLESKSAPKSEWTLIAEDICSILKFWFNNVNKIMETTKNWWSYLDTLLTFSLMLNVKSSTMSNILVDYIAEDLLDLTSVLEMHHMVKVLLTLNYICVGSTRQIRMALKDKLDPYLAKLSTKICTSQFYPVQLLCMETLIRWLVNRDVKEARIEVTNTWFRGCSAAIQLFQDCPFKDFVRDTRWFLNQHNDKEHHIMSVACRRLAVGNVAVVTGEEGYVSYLDINISHRCVSVVLTPAMTQRLDVVSGRPCSHEVLVISGDHVTRASLYRESGRLLISVSCTRVPKLLYDSTCEQIRGRELIVQITSIIDLTRLDSALNKVFRQHYQNNLEVGDPPNIHSSPYFNVVREAARPFSFSDDDRNSSIRRRRNTGYKKKFNQAGSLSSVSTTELAQLPSRLADMKPYQVTKQPRMMLLHPELSTLSEITEPDSSLNCTASSISLRAPNRGVKILKQKSRENLPELEIARETNNSSRSILEKIDSKDSLQCQENEILRQLDKEVFKNNEKNYASDDKTNGNDKNETIDIIEDTPMETKTNNKINKSKETKQCVVISNSSNESNTDAYDTVDNFVSMRRNKKLIKETDIEEFKFFSEHLPENNICEELIDAVVARKINASSESESDESDNIPLNKLMKDDITECLNNIIDKVCHDLDMCVEVREIEKLVDEATNNDDFIPATDHDNHSDKDIQDRPKYINDKKYDKSVKIKQPNVVLNYLNTIDIGSKKYNIQDDSNSTANVKPIGKNCPTTSDEGLFKEKKDLSKSKKNTEDKKIAPKQTAKKNNSRNKLKFKIIKKDSTKRSEKDIEIQNTDLIAESNIASIYTSPVKPVQESPKTPPNNDKRKVTSKVHNANYAQVPKRKKRKLYSPKDDEIEQAVTNYDEIEILSDSKLTDKNSRKSYYQDQTPKKKQKRFSRSKSKPNEVSPRTAKCNAIFDDLIKGTESIKKIFIVDKTSVRNMNVYSFSSDSENEYFKQKTINIKSRLSSTTLGSNDSSFTRRGRKIKNIDYNEKNSSESDNKLRHRKRKSKSKTPKIERPIRKIPLIDEKMREANYEDLNTSFVVEQNKTVCKEMLPPLIIHEMEIIDEKNTDNGIISNATKEKYAPKSKYRKNETKVKSTKSTAKINKLQSKTQEKFLDNVEEKSDSILPDLVIEPVHKENDLEGSISSNNFTKKCKKLIELSMDTNTTHNLLSDTELHESGYSPPKQHIECQNENNLDNEYINNGTTHTENLPYIAENLDAITIPDSFSNDNSNKPIQNIRGTKKETGFKTHLINKPNHNKNITEAIEIESDDQANKAAKTAEIIRNIKKEGSEPVKTINSKRCNNISSEIEEKSMSTDGEFPITGHGEVLELPPTLQMLKEVFTPRNIQAETFDESLQDFFNDLNSEMQKCNTNDEHLEPNYCLTEIKSPVVSLNRIDLTNYSSGSSTNIYEIENCNSKKEKTRSFESKGLKEHRNNTTPVISTETTQRTRVSIISPILSYKKSSDKPKKNQTDTSKPTTSPPLTTRSQIKRGATSHKSDITAEDSPSSPKIRKLIVDKSSSNASTSPSVCTVKSVVKLNAIEESESYKKVDEWLRSQSTSAVSSTSADRYNDCLHNILEKIEVTLNEEHLRSSEATFHMLLGMREDLHCIEKKMDTTFANIEKHVREAKESFKNMLEVHKRNAKDQAVELLNNEGRNKRVILSLLKEHVESYLRPRKTGND